MFIISLPQAKMLTIPDTHCEFAQYLLDNLADNEPVYYASINPYDSETTKIEHKGKTYLVKLHKKFITYCEI